MNYTVLGLTRSQTGQGGLSAILNLISDAFWQSSQRAVQNRNLHLSEHWATVLFDDALFGGPPSRYEADTVLYANDEAMRLIRESGMDITVLDENVEDPGAEGTLANMPIWR